MNKKLTTVMTTTAALALAACGSADDASTESQADTVELPAEEAVADVDDVPVADPVGTSFNSAGPAVTEPVVGVSEDDAAQEAGANAADVAARARAAAAESATGAAENSMN